MTSLVLRWRKAAPPVATRWRGPDGAVVQAAADPGTTPVAAVVGPPGPVGPVGGFATRIAGEALGGHRAVTVGADGKAYLASPVEPVASAVFGVTAGAVASGAAATILCAGEMSEPSWSWAPGPVWLGASGTLTQVLPVSGALVQIGISAGSAAMTVAPRIVARL